MQREPLSNWKLKVTPTEAFDFNSGQGLQGGITYVIIVDVFAKFNLFCPGFLRGVVFFRISNFLLHFSLFHQYKKEFYTYLKCLRSYLVNKQGDFQFKSL